MYLPCMLNNEAKMFMNFIETSHNLILHEISLSPELVCSL